MGALRILPARAGVIRTEDSRDLAIGCSLLSRSQEMFVRSCRPVAEEAGVRLAAHPDDPPLPVLRGVSKLIYHPDRYQKMLDICECGVCLSRRYLSMFSPKTF
eukprot:COSAG04_NODE_1117_length_8197_cov_19.090258_6_plen_103_part_00